MDSVPPAGPTSVRLIPTGLPVPDGEVGSAIHSRRVPAHVRVASRLRTPAANVVVSRHGRAEEQVDPVGEGPAVGRGQLGGSRRPGRGEERDPQIDPARPRLLPLVELAAASRHEAELGSSAMAVAHGLGEHVRGQCREVQRVRPGWVGIARGDRER